MNRAIFILLTLLTMLGGINIIKAEFKLQSLVDQYDITIAPTAESIKEKSFVRRAKGMRGLGLFGGLASIGPIVGLELSYQFLLSSHFKILSGIEWKDQDYVTYRSLFLQPTVYHTFFTNYHNFCLNMGGGLILTYIKRYDEKVDRGTQNDDKKFDKGKSNFNAGLVLGGEIELFLAKTLEINLSGGPIVYLFKDDYDRISYYLSLGLKFNF